MEGYNIPVILAELKKNEKGDEVINTVKTFTYLIRNSPKIKNLKIFIQDKGNDDEKILPFCACLLVVYKKFNKNDINQKPQRQTFTDDLLVYKFYNNYNLNEMYLVIDKSQKCSCGKFEEIKKKKQKIFPMELREISKNENKEYILDSSLGNYNFIQNFGEEPKIKDVKLFAEKEYNKNLKLEPICFCFLSLWNGNKKCDYKDDALLKNTEFNEKNKILIGFNKAKECKCGKLNPRNFSIEFGEWKDDEKGKAQPICFGLWLYTKIQRRIYYKRCKNFCSTTKS